jgi:5-formyltetrahydrofolate cyclo-ligase
MPPTSSSSVKGHDGLALAKSALRRKAAVHRQNEADVTPGAALQLASYSQCLIETFGLSIYAAYMPIRSEISPLPLVKALMVAGAKTAMPITPAEGQPLSFRVWKSEDPMVEGPYGTRQPCATAPIILPKIIFAPLLAFDEAGRRLGYGGGFYDRTIANMTANNHEVQVIGLAYDGQKLDKVPVGRYDMPLDAVLCPSGLYRPQK